MSYPIYYRCCPSASFYRSVHYPCTVIGQVCTQHCKSAKSTYPFLYMEIPVCCKTLVSIFNSVLVFPNILFHLCTLIIFFSSCFFLFCPSFFFSLDVQSILMFPLPKPMSRDCYRDVQDAMLSSLPGLTDNFRVCHLTHWFHEMSLSRMAILFASCAMMWVWYRYRCMEEKLVELEGLKTVGTESLFPKYRYPEESMLRKGNIWEMP